MLLGVGLFVVFSASGEDWGLLQRHGIRILVSLVALLLAAQVPPDALQRWSPYVFLWAWVHWCWCWFWGMPIGVRNAGSILG